MFRRHMRVFISFCFLCGLLAVDGKQERVRQELNAYHDQFMNHVETSLAHLNDTLHKWRHHEGTSRAHTYLSQATKHSVDALTRLEDIVTSREGTEPSRRRRLKQIYDDTSKQEADKRLEDAKKRAEGKFKNALVLLQEAAQKAAQNTSAELLNQLNTRLEDRNIISGGKVLSQELETMRMASKLFDLTKGLFPEGSTPSPSPPPPPPPVKVEQPKSSVEIHESPLEENLTAFDFYKEKSAVFERFDDTVQTLPQGSEGPLMRRRRLSQTSDLKNKYNIIDNVEESLKTMRSLGEHRLALSKESVEKIKQAAQHSREKYAKLVQDGTNKIHGRRLSQDTVVDSEQTGSDEYLTFPGESFSDSLSRIGGSGPDEVVEYQGPVIMETTTFVFIPVANTTDAQELIDQILSVIMSSMAEAAVPLDLGMFDEYPFDTNPAPESERALSWNSYHEKTSAVQRRRKLHSSMGQDIANHGLEFDDSYELTVYVYDPVWFRDAQDQKLISSIESQAESKSALNAGDDSFQISLAIRMSSPEELGGLSEDMIQFLGVEDIPTIESMYQSLLDSEWDATRTMNVMPRFSVFNYPQKMYDGIMAAPESRQATVKQASNEGLADVIVQKLQNSLYRPAEASSHADPFDLRWLGVMFGIVGIVMVFVMGSITAFRRGGSSGYMIIDDGNVTIPSTVAVVAQQQSATKSANRKVSNLPA